MVYCNDNRNYMKAFCQKGLCGGRRQHHVDYFAKIKPAIKDHRRVAVVDCYHDKRSSMLGFFKFYLVPHEQVIKSME